MPRRSVLGTLTAGAGLAALRPASAPAAARDLRITRVRFYHSPRPRATVNQSTHVVVVDTDQGISGVGEGGSAEAVERLAGLIIGEDASRTEYLWQLMYRGLFYPPGRERLHALGAIDLALWDIEGKALGVPVHRLLGGAVREHVECYATAYPRGGSLADTARACTGAGFRAIRISAADPDEGQPFDAEAIVSRSHRDCVEVAEAVGPGRWAIDYHTRLDLPHAVRLSALIEPLRPYFAEDLVRSEDPEVYRTLRPKVGVPIAVGEHFGDRWEIAELVEGHLIDYARVTLPNAGGITELVKIAALCETHYVGLIPHFTGPVATAALAHVCSVFPGPALMEILGEGPAEAPHLPEHFDFRDGKVWPNERPGLGVAFDPGAARLVAEVSERRRPTPLFHRPDGSLTNW